MFGVQKLKDEIEGLREEKDFFRSKFLEQVSEISALKDALARSEKEVGRLRRELMGQSPAEPRRKSSSLLSPYKSPTRSKGGTHPEQLNESEEKKEDQDDHQQPMVGMEHIVMSSLTVEEEEEEEQQQEEELDNNEDDFSSEDEDEQVAIRQKAEQLVRWASYRQEVLSTSSPRCSVTEEATDDDEEDETSDGGEQ
uniref:Uncharacterized protein n=1 Tax=Amphora coffeiformis TaxID=265554 RepID=A0A7S3L2K2_9STRA|mmetsp:Transcript_25225/g.47876  ORF Transcript_25225/g.47876 Transcript_25225/m.47876 type:complete len:196 (-) Transcript_25225:167-754(-)